MKKKLSVLLAVMMLCGMCSPISKAFAEVSSGSETETETETETVTSYESGYAIDRDTGVASNELSTYVITTGSEADLDTAKSFYIGIPADTKEIILPLTIPQKGILICGTITPSEWTSTYLDLTIYADAACTEQITYSSYSNKAVIPKKGTYYFKFKISDYSDTQPTDGYEIGFFSQFYTGNDKVLKNNTWVCSGNIDTSKPIYYKITASKDGSLTIYADSEYSTKVTLLNSSKKAISEEVYSMNDKVCFAVKKGTYYIKVAGSSEYTWVKSTFAGMNDYSGTTKAKAKKLAQGKMYPGYMSATDKKGTVDWYKITLTKSQKVDVTFTGSVSSGSIDLEFYGNGIGGSITKSISTVDTDKSFSATTWTSDTLPKGTYYIKVTKSTAKTSGFYKIRFDK